MILIFMPMRLKSSRDVLTGVYRRANERGWRVQLFDSVPDRKHLQEILRHWNPRGCLVYTGDNRDLLPPVLFGRIPTVYLSDRRPGRFSVNQDPTVTANLASEELLQCGVRSLAYFAPERDALWSRERCRAFKITAKLNKLPFHQIRSGDPDLQDFLLRLPKPLGILAAADAYAAEIVNAAEQAGLAIPSDMPLISVDNDTMICENLHPTLTSVAHNFEYAGYLLVKLIEEQLANPKKKPIMLTYVPLGLVRRASTRHDQTPPKIAAAKEYIRLHATENIGVKEVALALGLNRRALERLFYRQSGPSVATLIRQARLAKAVELLRNPQQAIGPIANLCGFASEAHLKTLFKLTYGMTMRTWRTNHP